MAQWETALFTGVFLSYFVASCLYIAHLVLVSERWGKMGTVVTFVGFGFNTAAMIVRTMLAGHAPFANMYEFGISFVCGLVLFYLYLEYRHQSRSIGVFVLPVAFLLSGVFSAFYQEARPLMPALKSNWLLAHVFTAVVAYGALAISFAVALMYLWKAALEESNALGALTEVLPSLPVLDQIANRAIAFAMPFLTLLIITGAVWAEYAWGTYWRWDPKETWSLITWLVYAIYLHGRLAYGWQGRKAMKWAIFGFVVVLFTFIGVNVLLPGLHSYASLLMA
jgi:cytochrome c-type biogenesis protein CcsB